MTDTPQSVTHVCVGSGFAGVEQYVCTVAREQARRGLQVTVVGGAAAEMSQRLQGVDVRVRPAATVVAGARQLRRLGAPDVMHAHMTAGETAALIAAWRWPSLLVTTRHFAAQRGRLLFARVARPLFARGFDVQISISNFVSDRVAEPTVVVPNGVETREQALLAEPRILVAQRLQPEKDTATCLEAFARSGLATDGWTLELAGDGIDRARLEDLARRAGVADSVHFLGWRSDLPDLLHRSSIFLASSPTEHFGLSVVEAMAHGVPVVAAAGGAHLETVGPVDHVGLFTPSDAASCAAALRSLASDRGVRVGYGRRLRERQQAHYSIEGHVDSLLSVYRESLSLRERRTPAR